MRYQVIHSTTYRYAEPVGLCQNEAYLTPRQTTRQRCRDSRLVIEPQATVMDLRTDFFGNQVNYFAVQIPHQSLVVTCVSQLEVDPALILPAAPAWELVRDRLDWDAAPPALEARGLRLASPFVPAPALERDSEVARFAAQSFEPARTLLDAVADLTARIYKDFEYDPEFTTIVTPLTEVLAHRRGVCQDFAHLAIACLRSLGLAARYVSGYLETRPPPGTVKLRGADASHAWFAVYLPEFGWVDFDPTNNQTADEHYITTAWGRDYGDVTPLKGVIFGGGEHELDVAVDVDRID